MSTNTNPYIPDPLELEQLANEIFSSYSPNNNNLESQGKKDTRVPVNTQQPGFGGGVENVPSSVAGSGISPSALNQRNAVDLNDPITSLYDPNIPAADGNIPQSVGGSGMSPSIISPVNSFELFNAGTSLGQPDSFEDSSHPNIGGITPLQKELDEILGLVNLNVPSGQLPASPAYTGATRQYYFLPGFAEADGIIARNYTQTPINGNFPNSYVKPPFDLNLIRNDFPILSETVNGRRLVWLDNAATMQKPRQVIDRLSHYYLHENSNIHRAAHTLAARATDAYEEARNIVKQFINARSPNEIVFVRGTTEAINLIAQSWGEQNLKEGDEIIISHLEHHANIVPWQILSQKKGTKLKVIPVDNNGELLIEEYEKLLSPRTKIISVTAVSNALGTVTPIKQIIDIGHQHGVKVLVDAAQSISHIPTDVQNLNADWLVFSGHKIYGPTGIGVVYGKEDILNATQPWQGGGNMIKDVTFEHTEYNPAPSKFEAGTGNIADAVGLGEALKYVSKLGIELIHQYETALIQYATQRLKQIPGLHIIGNAKEKAGAVSFVLDGFETVKIGGLLSKAGVAVRAGHHCAQPILRRFGVDATVRPSFAFYNTCSDIDELVRAIDGIRRGVLA